jgi:hypothetical protein
MPPLGWRERPEHDVVYFDMRQRARNESDARTRLHQHQRGLKVFHFGDNRAAECRLPFGIPVIRSGRTFRTRMTS